MLGAVVVIEQWWIRVRGRRIFKILKEAVCSAVSVPTPVISVPLLCVCVGALSDI